MADNEFDERQRSADFSSFASFPVRRLCALPCVVCAFSFQNDNGKADRAGERVSEPSAVALRCRKGNGFQRRPYAVPRLRSGRRRDRCGSGWKIIRPKMRYPCNGMPILPVFVVNKVIVRTRKPCDRKRTHKAVLPERPRRAARTLRNPCSENVRRMLPLCVR